MKQYFLYPVRHIRDKSLFSQLLAAMVAEDKKRDRHEVHEQDSERRKKGEQGCYI